jgi:hypothetical protein
MASPRPAVSTSGTGRTKPINARDASAPQEVSVARRLGVVLVVATLGGTIVLAAWNAAGRGEDRAQETPAATPAATAPVVAGPVGLPNVAPVIAPPNEPLISRRTWVADVTIPDPGMPLDGLELRVFRNGRQVAHEALDGSLAVRVRNVRLAYGRNEVSAALANELGEGLRSQPVVITVDDRAPALRIREPKSGDVVNSAEATIRGTSEPDAQLSVRNANNDATRPVTVREDGTFIVDVPLGRGRNALTVTAVDALGNDRDATVTVTRGDPADNARLTLRPRAFKVSDLPGDLNVRLNIDDASGRPVDGAAVIFSLSPSGQPTSTYQTTTVDGEALWSGIQIPRQGAVPGRGFVTARVTLPSGEVVNKSAPLAFN